jgi:hypothetical protein
MDFHSMPMGRRLTKDKTKINAGTNVAGDLPDENQILK